MNSLIERLLLSNRSNPIATVLYLKTREILRLNSSTQWSGSWSFVTPRYTSDLIVLFCFVCLFCLFAFLEKTHRNSDSRVSILKLTRSKKYLKSRILS